MGLYAVLAVAIPLAAAAIITAFGQFVRSLLVDLAGIAVAAAVAVLATLLLVGSISRNVTYWFGGWQPVGGVPIGISFVIEPFGAALALLAAVLVLVTFIFSYRYFDEGGALFRVLVLVFLAAMVGFALTGDLFNLFVFFELMDVVGFALTAYRSDKSAPLQGAFNFTVSNSVAAFLILFGIALLYGRTDALNMAQIGRVVAQQPPDGLLITAFTLITCGFLVKAAVVPFHFWLADAYAVAPAPVCVLFSAIMSDLGLYAVAEIYWTIFATPLTPISGTVRGLFLTLGTLTALVGAAMCYLQRHLKRLLAFATISHIGCFLLGIALLTPTGLAGTAIYLVADGLLKGGLFLAVGVLLYSQRSGDELILHGRGRGQWLLAGVFTVGGLGLAAIPPFGSFLGKSLIEDSASHTGAAWVAGVLLLAEAITGGAVLRAPGRIFFGLGPHEDPLLTGEPEKEEEQEPEPQTRRSALLLTLPAALLIAAGLGLAFAPHLAGATEQIAQRFEAPPAQIATAPASELQVPQGAVTTTSVLLGVASTLGALTAAGVSLGRNRLPKPGRGGLRTMASAVSTKLRRLHSGHVGDYVAWLTAGVAVFGAVLAVAVR